MGGISPHKKKESKRNITSVATYMKKNKEPPNETLSPFVSLSLELVAGWGVLA
jgi:hypothetical protein